MGSTFVRKVGWAVMRVMEVMTLVIIVKLITVVMVIVRMPVEQAAEAVRVTRVLVIVTIMMTRRRGATDQGYHKAANALDAKGESSSDEDESEELPDKGESESLLVPAPSDARGLPSEAGGSDVLSITGAEDVVPWATETEKRKQTKMSKMCMASRILQRHRAINTMNLLFRPTFGLEQRPGLQMEREQAPSAQHP